MRRLNRLSTAARLVWIRPASLLVRMAVLLLLFSPPASPSWSSIYDVLHDAAQVGRLERELTEGVAAGRAVMGAAEFSSRAATVLAAAGAAGYLTQHGGDLLLYLSGHRDPIRLLQSAADISDGLATRMKPAERLVIDADFAGSIGARAENLAEHYQLMVFDPRYGTRPVTRFGSEHGSLLIQLDPGLAMPLRHAAIPDDIWTLLSKPVRQEQIKIMAMISQADPGALARLLSVGGDHVAVLPETVGAGRPFVLKGFEDTVTVMIGHVEKDAFVLNGSSTIPERRIGFAEIEAEAARTNTTVLYVGCESFSELTGSGYVQKIVDPDVAAGVTRAFAADTYRHLLGAFGTRSNPFVIIPGSFRREASRVALAAERLNGHAAHVKRGALGVRVAGKLLPAEAAATEDVLAGLGNVYLFGLLPAALGFRRSWATYNRLFPALPNGILRPGMFRLARAGKVIVFCLLLPTSALWVTIIVIAFGGWSYREDLFVAFWSLFLRPLTVAAFLCGASFMLIMYCLVAALGCAILMPGLLLLQDAGNSGHPLPAIAGFVLLCASGVVLFLISKKRPFDMPSRLIDLISQRVASRVVRFGLLALPATVVVGGTILVTEFL